MCNWAVWLFGVWVVVDNVSPVMIFHKQQTNLTRTLSNLQTHSSLYGEVSEKNMVSIFTDTMRRVEEKFDILAIIISCLWIKHGQNEKFQVTWDMNI